MKKVSLIILSIIFFVSILITNFDFIKSNLVLASGKTSISSVLPMPNTNFKSSGI